MASRRPSEFEDLENDNLPNSIDYEEVDRDADVSDEEEDNHLSQALSETGSKQSLEDDDEPMQAVQQPLLQQQPPPLPLQQPPPPAPLQQQLAPSYISVITQDG